MAKLLDILKSGDVDGILTDEGYTPSSDHDVEIKNHHHNASYEPKNDNIQTTVAKVDVYEATNFIAAKRIGLATICILGDSFDERANLVVSVKTQAHAIWHLINQLMGGKLDFINIDGVSGSGANVAPTYVSRLQASVLDYSPEWCAVRSSVNDIHTTQSLADMITAYSDVFTSLNNAGIKIITNTIQFSNLMTSADRSKCIKYNQWLIDNFDSLFSGVVLDQSWQTRDNTSINGAVDVSLASDGLHPDLNGAFLIAKSSAEQLLPYFKNNTFIDGINGRGVDDASVIATNPCCVGEGGVAGAGTTGIVATNMELTVTGGSAVASKVTRTDASGEWQQVVFTSTAANQYLDFKTSPAVSQLNSGVQVGDIVQLFCEFECDSSTPDTDAHYPILTMQFRDISNGVIGEQVIASIANAAWPALGKSGWSMTLKTVKVAIPLLTTQLHLRFTFFSKVAGEMTIRFGRHGLINYSR